MERVNRREYIGEGVVYFLISSKVEAIFCSQKRGNGMIPVKQRVLLSLLMLITLLPLPALAERIALVMGNQAYTQAGVLQRPVADAKSILKALESQQIRTFENKGHYNLTGLQMEQLLVRFKTKIQQGRYDTVIIYYAGHGVQYGGENFLIPVDIDMSSAAIVKHKAMNVSLLLDYLKEAGTKVNILFLDACRNNPFRGSRGLTRVTPPSDTETIISYATASNAVAADASPYTPALAKLIRTQPQLSIERLLKKLRAAVRQATKGKQSPDYSSSFSDREFCFGACTLGAVPPISPIFPIPPKQIVNHKKPTLPLAFEPKMVFITGGRFQMGSPASEKGRYGHEKQHSVQVGDFWMAQTETTFKQWQACVDDGGCQSNKRPDDEGWGRGNRPVINVNWQDANQYAHWLSKKTGKNYRLPTEAQWEYAARAGRQTAYAWGNQINCGLANYGYSSNDCKTDGTKPVARYKAYAGLYDMHGNVNEWTCSAYDKNYGGSEKQCAKTNDKRSRVLRGGSWISRPGNVRSANRSYSTASDRYYFVGFRLSRTH